MKEFISAIDIGSSLIRVVVGRIADEGLEVVGVGAVPSRGVRGGVVVNIESVVQSIADAAREAELMSGMMVQDAYVNVSGKHLRGENSRGVVAITNRERVVTESDVYRVIEGAQYVRIPADQEILHVLAREFTVDDQVGIKDPIGMTGVRLEGEVHIVMAARTALTNLNKAVNGAGIRMIDGIMSSLASAESSLSSGEKDLGTVLVDIGGGVCDLAIYLEGGLFYSSVVPLGGIHVTQDLSIGLKLPLEQAEIVKKTMGCARMDLVDPTDKVELPAVSGRPPRWVLVKDIAAIIEPRMREIFEFIDEQLVRSGKKNAVAGGIVLTGGGALLDGTVSLAEEVLGLSATVASPAEIGGFSDRVDSPEYATSVGLLKFAARLGDEGGSPSQSIEKEGGILSRLKSWFQENL
ncbi:MAG: cell division protein FtsA [Leptospiraceae bacterium]|nr:cell division protein FtsA [Leptospiraceae bacterium]MCB1304060.1 cell division protein FtsA [Leptospiraceae bacterium]